jgi:hypothetical protein
MLIRWSLLLLTMGCVEPPRARVDSTTAVPAGVTAQCRDGSYSHAIHRSGTCSHHAGVAVWFTH